MSPATAVGIVVTVVLAVSLVIVGVMFWWGAREDGRDQARIDEELRKSAGRRASGGDKP